MITITYKTTPEAREQYLADVKEHGAFKAMMLKMTAYDASAVPMTAQAAELLEKCKEFCETQLKPEADHDDVIAYLDVMPKIAIAMASDLRKDANSSVDYINLYQAFELVVGQYPRSVRIIKGEEKPFDPTQLKEVKGFNWQAKQPKKAKSRKKR